MVLSNLTILLGRHFFESQIHAVYVHVWIQSLIGPAGPEDLLGKAPPEAPLEAPTSPEVSGFITMTKMAKMAKKIGNIADLRVLPLTP